jgi:hypothetical protein
MSKIVFFLGAGASKDAGAPLMKEFLDVAADLRASGKISQSDFLSFDSVLRARSALQKVHSKAQIGIHNVEEVFSAFEMASTLGVLGEYSEKEIDDLRRHMRVVIARTIEQTLVTEALDRFQRGTLPNTYDYFAQELLSFPSRLKESVSFITFNYDLAIDLTVR